MSEQKRRETVNCRSELEPEDRSEDGIGGAEREERVTKGPGFTEKLGDPNLELFCHKLFLFL